MAHGVFKKIALDTRVTLSSIASKAGRARLITAQTLHLLKVLIFSLRTLSGASGADLKDSIRADCALRRVASIAF